MGSVVLFNGLRRKPEALRRAEVVAPYERTKYFAFLWGAVEGKRVTYVLGQSVTYVSLTGGGAPYEKAEDDSFYWSLVETMGHSTACENKGQACVEKCRIYLYDIP